MVDGYSIFNHGQIICKIAMHSPVRTVLSLCLVKKTFNRWINGANILQMKVLKINSKYWKLNVATMEHVERIYHNCHLTKTGLFSAIDLPTLNLFSNLRILKMSTGKLLNFDDLPATLREVDITMLLKSDVTNIDSEKHVNLNSLLIQSQGDIISSKKTLDFKQHAHLQRFEMWCSKIPHVTEILLPDGLLVLMLSLSEVHNQELFILPYIPKTLVKLGMYIKEGHYLATHDLDVSSLRRLRTLLLFGKVRGIKFGFGREIIKFENNSKTGNSVYRLKPDYEIPFEYKKRKIY
jgi:hypothetical protein